MSGHFDWASLPTEIWMMCLQDSLGKESFRRAMELRSVNRQFRSMIDVFLAQGQAMTIRLPLSWGRPLNWVMGLISRKCPDLRSLSVRHNHDLTDAILAAIPAQFPKLETIDLYNPGTDITDDGISALGQLQQLKSISIIPSPDSLLTPAGIAHVVKERVDTLDSLMLVKPYLDEDAYAAVAKCTKLKKLCLTYDAITNDQFQAIARGCPNLASMTITNNEEHIKFEVPMPKIKKMYLGLDYSRVAAKHVESLVACCPNVVDLSLSNNEGVEGLELLAGLKHLTRLHISNARVGDADFETIASCCPNLTHLSLYYNPGRFTFRGLSKLKKLTKLNVSYCGITDEQLATIVQVVAGGSLRLLEVRSSDVTEEIRERAVEQLRAQKCFIQF